MTKQPPVLLIDCSAIRWRASSKRTCVHVVVHQEHLQVCIHPQAYNLFRQKCCLLLEPSQRRCWCFRIVLQPHMRVQMRARTAFVASEIRRMLITR